MIFKSPTLRRLLIDVALSYGVGTDDILSHARGVNTQARATFCHRALSETHFSSTQIGAFLDGRDHSTVLGLAGRLATAQSRKWAKFHGVTPVTRITIRYNCPTCGKPTRRFIEDHDGSNALRPVHSPAAPQSN